MNFRHSIATVKNTTLANRLANATLRKAAVGLTALGLALTASTQFGTAAAHAAADPPGTVKANAKCDSYHNTMTVSGTITLSSRFPHGAYVETAYAIWKVDAGGYRTSPIWYYYWYGSHADPSTIQTGYDYITNQPNILGNQPSNLYSLPFSNLSNQWRVSALVRVWNGSDWEYTNWDTAMEYDNTNSWGYTNLSGAPGSACVASLNLT